MYSAVLDACVLIPYPLFDVLLRCADKGMYRPLWSAEILDETQRNLIKHLGLEPERAAKRVSTMRRVFPDATVTGHEGLVPAMTNDPKDRHVMAAAVRANTGLIVTANLKDFAPEHLEPYGVAAIHPDDFLLDLLDLNQVAVIRTLHQILARNANPPTSVLELVATLEETVPQFAAELTALMR
ncbi:PIN domain-containing protein [Isoptericola jiangsuensis]|uniref:PIN domain-containing protein n=1 Tax=Isoptericola jiangsuensis TaxID=548579 RepID=A0A2A9EV94_9MICO|nr:PIN domain-containing protein [Isoptericola jiangsuensis]PFG42683.1 PIN domain-containing protein [Isoptericola jiangsuensis]